MDTEQNHYMPVAPTWKDNLRWKLFPSRHCDLPEAPATYKDVLMCRTWVTLGWIDRLRMVLTGHLLVETRSVTEHKVGNSITRSACYVLPPRWLQRRKD